MRFVSDKTARECRVVFAGNRLEGLCSPPDAAGVRIGFQGLRPWAGLVLTGMVFTVAAAPRLEPIAVSPDGRGFVETSSGRPFIPWGFNYDHDERGRLIEDYWDAEWPKVDADFHEMAALGANVVRVHLQFGKFMTSESKPNRASLRQLRKLLRLGESCGLRLDVTGLGCYHKQDVPPWYDALSQERRWAAQARFWKGVAHTCRGSPAVFCYDLMNEPVAPHREGHTDDWLGPPFGGKHFVQWIARDGHGRDRSEIAVAWIRQLSGAIREEDPRRLITVGLVPWSLDRPGLNSGFDPQRIKHDLDFISVHLYPEAGKAEEALETLRGFAVGKPVVIEETFPLSCSVDELRQFFQRSQGIATGWIGFYWGRTLEECRASTQFVDALMSRWLELFQAGPPHR
jgi:hypothetical protein